MSHERLWAPWRLDYVQNSDESKSTEPKSDQDKPACFLCSYRDSDDDANNLVLHRSDLAMVVVNRFPYNNGHLLIAPKAHKAKLQELTDDELLSCNQLLQLMIDTLDPVLTPDGYNVGLNLGRVAGAGLPGHIHWHIVPRWNGDTNFMAVLGDTKVIPQSLEAFYEIVSKQLSDR
jgi:ATP adenylyltransferase